MNHTSRLFRSNLFWAGAAMLALFAGCSLIALGIYPSATQVTQVFSAIYILPGLDMVAESVAFLAAFVLVIVCPVLLSIGLGYAIVRAFASNCNTFAKPARIITCTAFVAAVLLIITVKPYSLLMDVLVNLILWLDISFILSVLVLAAIIAMLLVAHIVLLDKIERTPLLGTCVESEPKHKSHHAK